MVEVSRDGRRVYLTNCLYSPWDAQFYPDGIKGWMTKIDVGHDGGMSSTASSSWNSRTGCVRTRSGCREATRLRTRSATRNAMSDSSIPLAVAPPLGAAHGINPGMGWLFAVGRGCRSGTGARCGARSVRSRWVTRSRSPLRPARVHARPRGAARLAAVDHRWSAARDGARWPRASPPRAAARHAGERARARDVVVSHGIGARRGSHGVTGAAGQPSRPGSGGRHAGPHSSVGRCAPARRTAGHRCTHLGYLAVTGALAWVVYQKLGLALLRRAWLNLDLTWAAALVIAGLATLVM